MISIQNEAFAECDNALNSHLHVSPCARPLRQRHLLVSEPSSSPAQWQLQQRDSCSEEQRSLQSAMPLSSSLQGWQLSNEIHRIFHDNIPPWLKTPANPRKPTQGQTRRVFLADVSGPSDREDWGSADSQTACERINQSRPQIYCHLEHSPWMWYIPSTRKKLVFPKIK